ncbi:MAG TPA: hypothetical protein PKB14_04215 [Rubrivivax sp.]|nr:hypothetical protein [Rubrivivax sp.]
MQSDSAMAESLPDGSLGREGGAGQAVLDKLAARGAAAPANLRAQAAPERRAG